MVRLPREYEFDPERAPIPGSNITEGASIDELLKQKQPDIPADDIFDSETLRYTYGFTAAAMLGAISVIAYRRLHNRGEK